MTSSELWLLHLRALLVQSSGIEPESLGSCNHISPPLATSGDCMLSGIVQSILVHTGSSYFPPKYVPPKNLFLISPRVCVLQMSLNSRCRMWCKWSQIALVVLTVFLRKALCSAKADLHPTPPQCGQSNLLPVTLGCRFGSERWRHSYRWQPRLI